MKKTITILVCLFVANLLSADVASFKAEVKDELLEILGSESAIEKFEADMEDWEQNRPTRHPKPPKENRTTYNTEMLIITNSTLENSFQQFAKLKNEEGIKTEVVTTSTTGSTASSIRTYLAALKNSNSDLTYVLLGGDASIIPTKSFYWTKSGVTKTSSTDFYYSNVLSTWPASDEVDEIDLSFDLYVGRIPVATSLEALIYLNKYKDYRTEETDYSDQMAFIATNVQRESNPVATDLTIDSVLNHVGANIITDVLYTDDLVSSNGCADPVINMLQDRDFSFLYGIWHASSSNFAFYDSEYDQFEGEWYERNFDNHRQNITIIDYMDDYGSCYYNDNDEYIYTSPESNYYSLYDVIPSSYGSTYVAWLGACATTDMISQPTYNPAQFEGGVLVQNYDINGYNTNGGQYPNPYSVTSVPPPINNSENCIAKEYFKQIGGPIAIYASSVDDYPYFTYRIVQEYMNLQFEDDYHKLGYLTRDSWQVYSSYLNIPKVREMYIGYTLFGDPSMDVWCAEAEQLVTTLDHGVDYKFTALNSSGVEVDAEIVVTNSSGTILGKGASPYTNLGRLSDDYLITANRANYIQARNTLGELKDYSNLPYTMTFENGIDYNWEMHSSNKFGRISVTDQYTPHNGDKHLIMDSKTGNYATNEAWLHLDLTNEDRVELNFWWKEFNDESHSNDGVYFSDDGGLNFTKVYSLTSGSTTWQEITLDVDALCSNYNLDYTSNFVIKFQQYDNYQISSDGFAFDDISVYSNYTTIPYSTGFESTGVDKYWEIGSNNEYGRVLVTNANSPYSGSKHLTMDVNTNGNYSLNEAKLYLNFTNIRYPELKFWWKEFGDETHTTDGVYFSDDGGASFEKVYDLSGSTNNLWQEIVLDIKQLATNHNLDLSSKFVIKFQQYDNYQIASDGFAFDDISVIETEVIPREVIDENEIISNDFLLSNHPNPFNPTTTISFSIPEEGKIELLVYNIKGQKVKTLANDVYDKGHHTVVWNGVDESGDSVSSGVYFYNLIVNGKSKAIKKCLMLK